MADRKCGVAMESVMLVAPVTALEFLGEDYLLAGEGPNLSVYSLHTPPTVGTTLTVLRNQRIHGIRPDSREQGGAARASVATVEEEEELEASLWRQSGGLWSAVLAVFGGKAVRVVSFRETEGGAPSLRAVGPLHQLQDWVCDVRWLRGGASLLAVALAHNAVLLLEAGSGRSLALRSCGEGCLLYSALLLGRRWGDLVLVGGTVFNQLVMWRPGGGGAGAGGRGLLEGGAEPGAPVERRLSGHSGVIFGLAYERRRGWLASASDDRSVRLWATGPLGGAAGCGDPAPACLRVLYGHQARVFAVRLSAGRVFSAGEDGACLQWGGRDGRLQRTLRGHRAGGVRALALSRGGWVATGGADGGVRLWRVGEGEEQEGAGQGGAESQTPEDLGFDGRGSPKGVRVIGPGGRGEGAVVVSTDQGEVYLWEGRSWRLLWAGGPEYQSYCVMEVVNMGGAGGGAWAGLCAVGSLTGAVCVFPLSQPGAQLHLRAGEGKVHSVLWAGRSGPRVCLLASGAGGLVWRWRVEVESEAGGRGLTLAARPLPSLLLPACAKRWLTAVVFLPLPQGALWFCGDRRGSLLLYRDQREGWEDEMDTEAPEGEREGEGDERQGRADERDREGERDEGEQDEGEREGEGDEGEREGEGDEGEREGRNTEALQPVWTLFGAHGKQGVTWVCEHQGALLSCGRDGCVRELRVAGAERLQVLRAERPCRGMEWVEKVLFPAAEAGSEEQGAGRGGRGMAVLGFHSVSFVVWDAARRERLLSVACGGGHRSWSYLPPRGEDVGRGGGLLFLKQGAVMAAWPSQGPRGGGSDSRGLKAGLHGRGVGCVCRLGGAGPWEVLASGGEDTSLSVLALRPQGGELAVLAVITDHISSVRALATVPRAEGRGPGGGPTDRLGPASLSALLISAGGRAQLQCYRLLIGWGSQPSPPTCQVIQVAGHRLDAHWERRRDRHKTVKMDPETRYMSLAVVHDGTAGVLLAVACSDGAVRVFSVSEMDGRFQLLWESFYHQRCVLSVASCWLEDPLGNRRLFVFSGATDGSVALWDVSALAVWRGSSTAELTWSGPDSPFFSVTVHQSGVNSLLVWEGHWEEAEHEGKEEAEPGEKEAACLTVASGGDDGQLSVANIRLQFHPPQAGGSAVSAQLQSQAAVSLAHAAPLTALQRLCPDLLVSTSPDQRVRLWRLTGPAPHQQGPAPHEQGPASLQRGPTVHHQTTLFSHVADAAGLEAWPAAGQGQEGRAWAVVCGQGLQLLRIGGEERGSAGE